jgi:hypothetical protein
MTLQQQLEIVDMTKMQSRRRQNNKQGSYPSFDTPGKVFHLLRSILVCPSGMHCASPWYHSSHQCAKVVALLVNNPVNNEDTWDELEEREISELLSFRTGDAAPSFYLGSTIELDESGGSDSHGQQSSEQSSGFQFSELLKGASVSGAMLLVYRHLPPRDILTVEEPAHTDCQCSQTEETTYIGCLWERYIFQPEAAEEIGKPSPVIKHRMISPPYLSHEQEYPGLLKEILDNIHVIREEAIRIPQWTAWPERNHYSSSAEEGDENDPYAAWTVFPLCHTFPADDVRCKRFIETTCSFVPKTTALLRRLGPSLRTALFSRLDGRTTLGTHTGWSDLANHVLRVHVPLVVPPGGLCGTWVDGW